MLGLTALLYLWSLDASEWANPYYAAAAHAGAQSWEAFFFGSLDAGNAITVDKPPLGLWPMALAVRLFGMSSWSLLVPQALEGVATVWLLYLAVRHTTRSARAGLLAGGLLATTPVATLMFRYNNPDALMTLLVVAAGYATVRALDARRALGWFLLAGTLIGSAFMTKMLEAFLVLPALALTYALFAATPWPRRAAHLLAAASAVLAASSWWLVAVALIPGSNRPYIGGSTTNSALELAVGYNGLARLTGTTRAGVAAVTGISPPPTSHGNVGHLDIITEILWLLPTAVLLGVGALALVWRRPDPRQRAGLVLWMTWLLVAGVTLCVMTGTFHSYYTLVLAPAVAAIVAIGGHVMWQARTEPVISVLMSVSAAMTAGLGVIVIVSAGADLRWLVVPICLLCATVFRLPRGWTQVAATRAILACTIGPIAFSIATAAQPHRGQSPMAWPHQALVATMVVPGRTTPPDETLALSGSLGALTNRSPSPAVLTMLKIDAGRFTWSAAVPGARYASVYELASGTAVLGIGGYKGEDPAPSLATFQDWVKAARVHYYFPDGTSGPTARAITGWVSAQFDERLLDGTTYYDLAAPPT